MTQWIDTHAHLDEEAFSTDLDDVLARADEAGVAAILTIGITAKTSQNAVALAERYDNVFAVVGIQPNYVSQVTQPDWPLIEELARHPRVVGIGETGLDRYWDYAPLDEQVLFFDRHMELAAAVGKPFVVHCREAEADVLEVLDRHHRVRGPLSGVMHSFCGDADSRDRCLEYGMHISFAGMITFKKNDDLRAVAAGVPDNRLLVETDAPYLAPVPKRGKRNEPAYVVLTGRALADVRGVPPEQIAETTSANGRALFRLPLR